MPTRTNPSHHVPIFVPYPFRPFWQPNSRASPSADNTQLEKLFQKLDTAENTIIEYAQLIASLYAEQKRYQDIICDRCRDNISRASLATAPLHTSSRFSQSPSRPTPAAPAILFEPTSTSATFQMAAELPLQSAPLAAHCDQSAAHVYTPVALSNNNLDGLDFAISSPDNRKTMASPHFADGDSAPPKPAVSSTPEESTNADPTQPDWSVEYNPKIKQTLNLYVANTFTFTAKVLSAKFSIDGKYLAVGFANGEILIRNMVTGSMSILVERSATVTEEAGLPSIWAARFSQDNKYIATGGSKGQINIWEIGRSRVRATFKHKSLVRSVEFSPDGRFLVSASHDKSVCMWRVRDGSRRIIMSHGTSNFVSVAFSPDGRSVAAGNDDRVLRIWDSRTGQLVAKCTIADLGSFSMRSMAFTPDGKAIASGSNILRCWDVSSLADRHLGRHMIKDHQMNQIWEFNGHKRSITAVSFSSDNLWVISSSLDRKVCILDARTGSWVCTLKGHMDNIRGADFSPDGHYIVSGSVDCRVRLWRCEIVE